MKKHLFLFLSAAAFAVSAADGVFTIENVTYSQNQNTRDVTITYTLDCPADRTAEAFVCFDIYTNGVSIGREKFKTFREGSAVSRDSRETFVADGTARSIVWRARKDWPDQKSNTVTAKVFVCAPTETEAFTAMGPHYLVLNLDDSSSFYYTFTGPDLASDTCRTSELWMKYVPGAEKITLGSPEDELGRGSNEAQYTCSLTGYYLGVFECTRYQWMKIIGRYSRSYLYNPDTRPVDKVVYGNTQNSSTDTLRGDRVYSPGQAVNASSFFGQLNSKFTAFAFDLPSEAQWEYACRAGTASALYTGKEITAASGECANVAEIARYRYNQDYRGAYYDVPNSSDTTKGHDVVGRRKPNAWGFYDMIGNVKELCRDGYRGNNRTSGTDPVAACGDDYWNIVLKGGYWYSEPSECRAAWRGSTNPKSENVASQGFRVQCKVK